MGHGMLGDFPGVALSGNFAGGSDEDADGSPREALLASTAHNLEKVPLGLGAFRDCSTEHTDSISVGLIGGVGLVVLEPCGQLIGVCQDLSPRFGASDHLGNFSRAGVACTITAATSPPMQRLRA